MLNRPGFENGVLDLRKGFRASPQHHETYWNEWNTYNKWRTNEEHEAPPTHQFAWVVSGPWLEIAYLISGIHLNLQDFVFFHICRSKFSFRVDLYGTWSHGHSNVINMKVASIATPHLLRPRAASRPGEVLVLSLDDQPNLKLMDNWTALGKLHLFRIFGE